MPFFKKLNASLKFYELKVAFKYLSSKHLDTFLTNIRKYAIIITVMSNK